MNKPLLARPLLALAAACFAMVLAMPAHAGPKAEPAGVNGAEAAQTSEMSSQRRYHRRYYGPRRAYWGPRRYWAPRRAYWGPRYRYWGPRRAYWGPRYYWRPRPVYWGPRPVYWGPRYWGPRRVYWGGPVISVGFGPRWWW